MVLSHFIYDDASVPAFWETILLGSLQVTCPYLRGYPELEPLDECCFSAHISLWKRESFKPWLTTCEALVIRPGTIAQCLEL